MGVFTIHKVKNGVNFSLKAKNGEVICTSQVYKSIESCKKGIRSIMRNSVVASLEDQTAAGYAIEKNPKWEVYVDTSGEYRFRLRAANGQNICHSQGYTTKESAHNGIESIKKNAPEAEIKLELEEE